MISLGGAYGEILIGTDQAEKSTQSLAQSMRAIGSTMSLAISTPLLAIAGTGLKAAGDFEQSMNMLQVAAGATGTEMESLQDQALELGRVTSFSAGEAAEGMLELAKAGFNTQQTMDAMSGVLDLAAAGEVDLASAAKITASALNTFGLEARQSGEIANMLAAAANASTADVGDLAQGLAQGGFAFAAAGLKADEFIAALAMLTNVGLTGSDGATALKNAVIRLMSPTDEAADLMKELGISVYDTNGNMISLDKIIDVFNGALSGMTQEQRNAALETILMSDGMKAMIPLLDGGSDGLLAMKGEVNTLGASTEMANARMGGLSGAIEYFKGTIESLLIETFLPFLDSLSGMLKYVADLIAIFNDLPTPVKNAALAFGAVLAAIGPVLLGIGTLTTVLGALLSPIGLIAVAIAGLAAAWAGNWGGIQEKTAAAWAAIQPQLSALYSWLTVNIPLGLTMLRGWWESAFATLAPAVTTAAGEVQTSWGALWTAMPIVVATARDAIMSAWNTLVELFGPSIDKLIESLGRMTSSLGELGPEFTGLGEAVQAAFGALIPILQGFGTVFAGVVYGVMIFGLNMLASAFEVLPEIVRTAVDLLTALFTGLAEVFQGVVELFKAMITGDWTGMWNAAGRIVAGVGIMITGIWNAVVSAITILWTWMADTVTGTLEDLGVDVEAGLATISAAWDTSWEAMRNTWTAAAAVFIAGFQTVRTWLAVTLPAAAQSLQAKFETIWTAIKSFLIDTVLAPIISTFEAISTFLTTTLPNAANSFKNFLGNLRLPNPFDAIAGAIAGIQGAIDAVMGRIQAFKDALGGISLPGWLGGGGASASSAQPVAASGVRSLQPVGVGAGGINVNVNIDAGGISSGVDVEALAYRVANRTVEEIRRRVR